MTFCCFKAVLFYDGEFNDRRHSCPIKNKNQLLRVILVEKPVFLMFLKKASLFQYELNLSSGFERCLFQKHFNFDGINFCF